MDLREELSQQIVGLFAAWPEVRRVILFGSRARNDADPRSDIDLAIEAPHIQPRQWLEMANRVEEIETLLPIDLVRLEDAGEPLRERILREGVILYERGKGGAGKFGKDTTKMGRKLFEE